MTEEESQQIIESKRNGLECQIRFLKIDGKSLRRDRRTMDGFANEGGLLHRQVKHSEITLPEFSSDNLQPIALDIMLRSEESHPSPQLYFFSVFLVILRKVDEIVGELFHSNNFVDESYLAQFKG